MSLRVLHLTNDNTLVDGSGFRHSFIHKNEDCSICKTYREQFTNAFDVSHGSTEDVEKAWILTYTGKKFKHLAPTPEMIDIRDIAHALSNLGRWTGHTKWFYPVAQHAVYCSYLVAPEFAFDALNHDDAEAYLGDMNSPLKHFTAAGPAYLKIEEKVEAVLFKKFGVRFPLPPEVKEVDTQMLYAERAQLLDNPDGVQYEHNKWGMDETAANIRIERWTARRAEKMFLRRFRELYKEK
jgi:hypothetical protein